MIEEKNNTMICDLETGICGVSDSDELEMIAFFRPISKGNNSWRRLF
ncbi:hypothetical protein [Oceanobacillus neutriphilus]|nr:hypothetical protein [Oceanobacillus neutriphilus]